MPRPVFFLLLLSLFLRIPALQEYTDCSSPLLFRCGKERLNVSYPFTTATRKAYCGVGEYYDLKCQEEGDTYIPVIEIDGRPYRVKNIDYEAGVLTISDLEIAKNACDPRPYGNAALDGSLFEYTPDDLNLTIYYNCTPVLFGSFHWLREVPCLALPGRSSYLTEGGLPDPLVMAHLHSYCSSVSMVPFRGAAAVSLDANGSASIQKAVAQGFDVWWKAGEGWCEDCLRSGGACGHNSSEPEAQLCFCPDDSRAGSCASSKAIKGIQFTRGDRVLCGCWRGGVGCSLLLSGYFRSGISSNGVCVPREKDSVVIRTMAVMGSKSLHRRTDPPNTGASSGWRRR